MEINSDRPLSVVMLNKVLKGKKITVNLTNNNNDYINVMYNNYYHH